MASDDDAQQLIAQYEATQAQLQQVDARLGRLEELLLEQRRAAQTLEGLGGEQEALVPIGAGLHVRARVAGDAPVVTPLGAGYAADRDLAKARASLQRRIAETQGALETASQQADRLAQTLQGLGMRLQSMQSPSS